MNAERLREAAALMRERAEVARAGRWVATDDEVSAHWSLGDVEVAVCCGSIPEGNAINATHIASWHPAVALAVAMLLDNEAAAMDASAARELGLPHDYNQARARLLADIAHAYLGTTDRSRPGLGTAGVTGAQPDEPASQAGRPVAGGAS